MKKKNEIPTWEEIRQMQAKTDRRFEETDRRIKKLEDQIYYNDSKDIKEADKILKYLHYENFGKSRNTGPNAKQYFEDFLTKKLTFGGVEYDGIIPDWQVSGKMGSAEFDFVLKNKKAVAIIEVEEHIHLDFLDELINKKATAFRKILTVYADCTLYLGIAGFYFDDEVISRAKEKGVGVLKRVGRSVKAEPIVLKAY